MHSHLCKPITGGGGRGRVAQYLKSKYGSIAAQWKKCPVADPPSDEAGESSVNWKLEEVYRRGTETVQPDAGGVQRVDSVVQQAGTALQGNSPQVTGPESTCDSHALRDTDGLHGLHEKEKKKPPSESKDD